MDERLGKPSASAMERCDLCAGSHALCQRAGPQPSGPDAEFGNHVHAALERVHMTELDLTPEEYECYAQTLVLRDKLTGESGMNFAKCTVLKEKRMAYTDPNGNVIYTGKPDLVLVNGPKALVIDYKTGRGEVAVADGNLQLRALAVLVFQEFSEVSEVTVAIIAPYGSPQVSSCRYTEADIETARNEILAICARTLAVDAPLNPGEAQCKYCAGRSICPQFALLPQAVASQVPSDESQAKASILCMSGDNLSRLLEACRMADMVRDLADAEAKRRLGETPESVPGWKLRAGAVRETITDPQKCFDRAFAKGVKVEGFLSAVTVKKKELRAELAEATSLKGKALDAAMDEVCAGIVETKQTAPVLVRA